MSKLFSTALSIVCAICLTLSSCTQPLVAQESPAPDKKQLEGQAKEIAKEAKDLEDKGQLKDAEGKYIEAEAVISTREGLTGLDRVRRAEAKKVESLVSEAHMLYDGGKIPDAVAKLEEAEALDSTNVSVHYNLAISYAKLNDRVKAVAQMDQCLEILPENAKDRPQLEQIRSSLATGDKVPDLTPETKASIEAFNATTTRLGKTTSGMMEADADTGAPAPSSDSAKAKTTPCAQLKELEPSLPKSAAVLFNLAKCAEEEGRLDDQLRYFNEYLATAPNAVDSGDVQVRLTGISSLTSLSDEHGPEVRSHYAAATRFIDDRKYDRAIDEFVKADEIMPNYPLTKWRLAILYEAFGNVAKAKEYFNAYESVETSPEGKKEAATHLETVDDERMKYDEAIRNAKATLEPLLVRSMGLQSSGTSGQGFVPYQISYPYAQQQLSDASKKLEVAAGIFPLGPEVNELLAIVYFQGNNPAAGLRCYDSVTSQNVPVYFYASSFSAHDKKQLREVKVELVRDSIRLVYLSSYDPKINKVGPPQKPAGSDELGDLVVASSQPSAAGADDLSLKSADLKGIETQNSYVGITTNSDEIYLVPLNVASPTPYEGVPARKFANNYTRLFLRYMGYDNAKLGKESMTGGEKFSLGMQFAAAGMGGYAAFAGGGFMMASQMMMAMYSLNEGIDTLRRSRADERQLVQGDDFKIIPTQSFDLSFKEKFE